MDYEDKDYNHRTLFYIYGDGELLYSEDIQGGENPIDFSVDISGVKILRIEMNDGYTGPHAYIGDCVIYK